MCDGLKYVKMRQKRQQLSAQSFSRNTVFRSPAVVLGLLSCGRLLALCPYASFTSSLRNREVIHDLAYRTKCKLLAS